MTEPSWFRVSSVGASPLLIRAMLSLHCCVCLLVRVLDAANAIVPVGDGIFPSNKTGL